MGIGGFDVSVASRAGKREDCGKSRIRTLGASRRLGCASTWELVDLDGVGICTQHRGILLGGVRGLGNDMHPLQPGLRADTLQGGSVL